MVPQRHSKYRQAYLVEHYGPGRQVEQLTRSVALVRAAVLEMERAGEPIGYIRSTIVPRDEAFLCIVEASSEHLVGEAYARAGVTIDRISAAITPEEQSTQSTNQRETA